ncbi:hypothetical protein EO94_05900 [Methanosarcina sp. 2.H.T.1A.3]|nr:hypothetical protein EO94_05900 [Methanosarcina sp. 2.H.T.1A.3]KKG21441.1 hypothetical protein EO97_01935 [Methanosarcina sp. 2.H.T.1A.15]
MFSASIDAVSSSAVSHFMLLFSGHLLAVSVKNRSSVGERKIGLRKRIIQTREESEQEKSQNKRRVRTRE